MTQDDQIEAKPIVGAPRPVSARIRGLLPSLAPSDARVARVILEEPDAVVHSSVSEVAQRADTSSATVVRCTQKLGFRGFHDLKIALAQELATSTIATAGQTSIMRSVLQQVIETSAQTVRDAAALVDPDSFDAAAHAIADANRVLFVGVGTSAPMAQDAAYRFSAIGLLTDAPPDAHVQHVHARLLEPADVCVAISHSGSTREILRTVQAAIEAGASTVAITSFSRSPLTELAHRAIVVGTREVSFQLEAMASRLAHLAVLDALLVAVAAHDENRTQAALALYADAISSHRL